MKFKHILIFKGTPILILGHHILYGKVNNMEKPMVLLKKQVRKVQTFMDELNEEDDENKMENHEGENNFAKTKTEYLVEWVIKRKILFNKRPRPIVHIEANKKL